MELFDYDFTTQKVSKYETNHLHMYVDGDIEFPNTEDMTPENYATFMHEYIHYVQHLTTLFGIRICYMNQRMFILYRDYLINHDEIKVPLHLWESDVKLQTFRETFRKIAGSKACSHNVCAVDVANKDIEEAKKNRTAVLIGCYDFDNEKIIEYGFSFGYWCIIEGMAHSVQVIINSQLNHDVVPYTAVQLVLHEVWKEYENDPKMIASICLCSLNWDNPAVGFFDVVEIGKKLKFTNGLELYNHIISSYSVKYKGVETPMFRLKKSISRT